MNDQRHDGKTINGQDWTCVCVDSKGVDCGGGDNPKGPGGSSGGSNGFNFKTVGILVTIWV